MHRHCIQHHTTNRIPNTNAKSGSCSGTKAVRLRGHRKKYRIPSPGFTLDFVQRSQIDPRVSQVDRLLTKFTVDLVVINLGSLYKIQAGNFLWDT